MATAFPTPIPVLFFLTGLLIGSFLNVCIYRIPRGENFVTGRSHCPACGSLIHWYCNIPLLSYMFLKGRCKDCGQRISAIYPSVELLNAVLYLLVYLVYGLSVYALLTLALFSLLIVLSFIDLKHQLIPDGLIIAILALGIGNLFYQTLVFSAHWYLWIIGFFAASVPLLILGLIVHEGMGGGDIKLMAAAGLFLGWKLILLALFLGSLYGGIVSAFLMLSKKATMKSALPFGPFLSLGIITAALAGNMLLSWYFSIFL